jgi:hypothetical protein
MLGVAVAAIAACGFSDGGKSAKTPPPGATQKPLPKPMFFGSGPRYRPPAYGGDVKAGRPIGRFACAHAARRTRFLAHVEVIADGRVAIMPSGIGIAPPQVRHGAYVFGGPCEYDLRTHEPTGLIEVAAERPVTVGDLFRVWGQLLSSTRLLSFAAEPGRRVVAFVGTRRWPDADPRSIPLQRHTTVTLEVGRLVAPRSTYAFPKSPCRRPGTPLRC